jgi:hypothetical protein
MSNVWTAKQQFGTRCRADAHGSRGPPAAKRSAARDAALLPQCAARGQAARTRSHESNDDDGNFSTLAPLADGMVKLRAAVPPHDSLYQTAWVPRRDTFLVALTLRPGAALSAERDAVRTAI